MKICSKCGREIRQWHEPYLLVRTFDLRNWKDRILEFFGWAPYAERQRKRYHVNCGGGIS